MHGAGVKVCFVLQDFPASKITGPSKHITDLSSALVSSGNSVLIICMSREGMPIGVEGWSAARPKEVDICELKTFGVGGMRMPIGILKTIRDEKPDVIHAQGYRNLFTDISLLAARMNRIPFILSPRGSLLAHRYSASESLIPVAARVYDIITGRFVLKNSDTVAVTSQFEKNDALTLRARERTVRTIPHGMVFPRIPPRRDLPGHPRLLTVSRIAVIKNLLDTIIAVKELIPKYPDIVLYIAGESMTFSNDSPERHCLDRIREIVQEEKLGDHVKLLGGIYGGELWSLYSSCDAFICASSYESFSFGLLEAAYFGLPIVSTDVGISSQLIGANEGGIVLQDHHPSSIREGIEKLLERPDNLESMGKHLREKAREYSIEKNMQNYLRLYAELIGRRQTPRR